MRGADLVLRHDRPVDLLQQVLAAELDRGRHGAVADVPGNSAALDHRLDLARARSRAVDQRLRTGIGGVEGLRPDRVIGRHGIAAPVDDDDLAALRMGRRQPQTGRDRPQHGQRLQEAAAMHALAFGLPAQDRQAVVTEFLMLSGHAGLPSVVRLLRRCCAASRSRRRRRSGRSSPCRARRWRGRYCRRAPPRSGGVGWSPPGW